MPITGSPVLNSNVTLPLAPVSTRVICLTTVALPLVSKDTLPSRTPSVKSAFETPPPDVLQYTFTVFAAGVSVLSMSKVIVSGVSGCATLLSSAVTSNTGTTPDCVPVLFMLLKNPNFLLMLYSGLVGHTMAS